MHELGGLPTLLPIARARLLAMQRPTSWDGRQILELRIYTDGPHGERRDGTIQCGSAFCAIAVLMGVTICAVAVYANWPPFLRKRCGC